MTDDDMRTTITDMRIEHDVEPGSYDWASICFCADGDAGADEIADELLDALVDLGWGVSAEFMAFADEDAEDEQACALPRVVKMYNNARATTLLFDDGTKAVSKRREGDPYLTWLGVLMCALRKASNNRAHLDDFEDALRSVSVACRPHGTRGLRWLSDALLVAAQALELPDEAIGHPKVNMRDKGVA